jgi:hypothetical protein
MVSPPTPTTTPPSEILPLPLPLPCKVLHCTALQTSQIEQYLRANRIWPASITLKSRVSRRPAGVADPTPTSGRVHLRSRWSHGTLTRSHCYCYCHCPTRLDVGGRGCRKRRSSVAGMPLESAGSTVQISGAARSPRWLFNVQQPNLATPLDR